MAVQKVGLRERKKLKTRAAIQCAAMRLFRERGYHETTIEDITGAAEISPATFFNYFPTKEDVVFQDDLDPVILAALHAQPPKLSPIRALRNALREAFENFTDEQNALLRQREALIVSVPELRAAMLNRLASLVREIAEVLAGQMGRSPNDFAVRNLAGALIGVIISSMLAVADDREADLFQVIDRALAHLEAGLPF